MTTEKAVILLRAYAACMLSENCSDCPFQGKCSGWTEELVLQALHHLNTESEGEQRV